MTKEKVWDLDKFRPNLFWLIISLGTFTAVIVLSDVKVCVLASISIVAMGWSFVFGKWKILESD